jgi:serine/threonine protein kinase
LLWGENWHIFKPDVPADHEHYELKILMKHHQYFGPFPLSYKEIADEDTLSILAYVMKGVPHGKMKLFEYVTDQEIIKEDKAFILKTMKLDPRDRPTAKELLQDEWF